MVRYMVYGNIYCRYSLSLLRLSDVFGRRESAVGVILECEACEPHTRSCSQKIRLFCSLVVTGSCLAEFLHKLLRSRASSKHSDGWGAERKMAHENIR